jgi:hypothetical protein
MIDLTTECAGCEYLRKENIEHALRIDTLERELTAERELSKSLYEALTWAIGNLTEYGHHQMLAYPETGVLEAIAEYERKEK